MLDATTIELPSFLHRDTVVQRLDKVLDPELDTSIVELGFIHSVQGDETGDITVELQLPTYWCSANFSYLMAFDIRRELLDLPGVHAVTVHLGEHFASETIQAGVGSGMAFGQAFPEGGPDTLEQTRQLFLRKGFLTRQELLLRHLKNTGLSFEEIAALSIADIRYGEADFRIVRPSGQIDLVGQARVARRYLERRAELGLDCSEIARLIIEVGGAAIAPDALETYYTRARTTRLAMEASGSLCSALLQARTATGEINNLETS